MRVIDLTHTIKEDMPVYPRHGHAEAAVGEQL